MTTDIKSLPDTSKQSRRVTTAVPKHNPGPLPVSKELGNANPEGHFERHTLTRPDRVIAKDGTRRGVEKQIAAVKYTIQDNLKRLRHALNRGQDDTALRYCSVVTKLRGQLLGLIKQAQAIQAQEAVAKKEQPRKSAIRVTVTRKTYKRWSEK